MKRILKNLAVYLTIFALFSAFSPVFGRTPPTNLAPADVELGKAGLVICVPVATETVNPRPIQARLYGTGFSHRILVLIDPEEAYGKNVFPGLLKNPVVQDSLKLRKVALNIRREGTQEILEKLNPDGKLSPEQVEALKRFLSAHVNQPLPILAKPPADKADSGNCASRQGSLIRGADGKNLLWSPNCLFLVGDLAANLENDTLSIVFGHENAHIIMYEMYGAGMRNFLRASSNGHMAPYMTDQSMALIEGWAEAFEAVYGPTNPRLSEKDRKKYHIPEFRFERQDPVRRERYIWARYFGKKTGVLKNGSQMMATEGVVAGLFYDILTSRAINAPFEKSVRTMLKWQPTNFPDFVRGYLKFFSEDRKVLTRIILENSRFVLMHPRAGDLYFRYYQANLAWKQKKVGKQALQQAKNEYLKFKEELNAQALAGADMFAHVGREMWFTGKIKASRMDIRQGWNLPTVEADRNKIRDWEFNLDLNTVTEKMLTVIGFGMVDAQKIIQARENAGFFQGKPLPMLKQLVGDAAFQAVMDKAALRDYHEAKAADSQKADRQILWPEAFRQGGAE
jgi:DNA uptake protein ComE-like DNA-binding protein